MLKNARPADLSPSVNARQERLRKFTSKKNGVILYENKTKIDILQKYEQIKNNSVSVLFYFIKIYIP